MCEPVVSLIVPVYRTEPFLAGCLDSLLGQTLREIEVLTVDDASPDGSAAVLATYAGRDSRLRVLPHPTNRGVAAARNTALDVATGRYVMFVDSDDRLAPHACQHAVAQAEQTGAQMVRFGFRWVDEAGRVVRVDRRHGAVFPLDTDAAWPAAYRACDGWLTVTNALLLRRGIEGVRFPPLTHGEDSVFGAECFCRARRVATLAEPLYEYVLRGGSAIHAWNPESFRSIAAACGQILEVYRRHGRYEALRDRLFRTVRHTALGVLGRRLSAAPPGAQRDELWAIWQEHFRPLLCESDLVPPARRRWHRAWLAGGSYTAFYAGLYLPHRLRETLSQLCRSGLCWRRMGQ